MTLRLDVIRERKLLVSLPLLVLRTKNESNPAWNSVAGYAIFKQV